MTETTEEIYRQVRNMLLVDPGVAKAVVPLMSDEALTLANEIITEEINRRLEKNDAIEERQQ